MQSRQCQAMKKSKILTKYDLKWIKKFNKTLKKKKDSISSYLKKARKFARNRKVRRAFVVLALAGAAAAAYFLVLAK